MARFLLSVTATAATGLVVADAGTAGRCWEAGGEWFGEAPCRPDPPPITTRFIVTQVAIAVLFAVTRSGCRVRVERWPALVRWVLSAG